MMEQCRKGFKFSTMDKMLLSEEWNDDDIIELDSAFHLIESIATGMQNVTITIKLNSSFEWEVTFFDNGLSVWHEIGAAFSPLEYTIINTCQSFMETYHREQD